MFDVLRPITGDPARRGTPWERGRLAILVLGAPFAAYALVNSLVVCVSATGVIDADTALVLGWLLPIPATLPLVLLAGLVRRANAVQLVLYELVLFVVLPAWGLAIDVTLSECDVCDTATRPVALPEAGVVYAAYGLGLVAYVVARTRPSLRGAQEALLLAGLGVGTVVCFALNVQFGGRILLGLMYPVIGLPLAAPAVIGFVWPIVAAVRLWRHPGRLVVAGGGAGLLVSGVTADLIAHKLVTGQLGLWAGAFARTCGWTLSQLEPVPQDCHYLCTVAARGHPWLVRPQRMGVRRGRPIVVNRQLAVANAFEDLLHERWPRFGAWARRTYDAWGRPICAYIRHPLVSDAVFIAMLPAQLLFELALRALDADPERRIDRMYR